MKLLTVIFILCTIGASYSDSVNINKAVDILLIGLRSTIIAEGKDQVTIPDLQKDWHKKIGHFISISCSLTCDGGWARQLSTIKRTGDVTMTTNGNKVTLNIKMGLGDLTAHYDKCRIHSKLLSVSNKVEASTYDASIDAQISLIHEDNTCKASLDHIFVDNLGKLKFDMGGGIFHKLESDIIDILANHFKDKVKNIINEHLVKLVSKEVSKGDLCSVIPY